MATGIEMTAAQKTRKAELTMRSLISVLTGLLGRERACRRRRAGGPVSQVQYCWNDRVVEVQLLAQGLEPLGRRLPAEDRARRIAQRLRGREDDDRDDEQHEQAEQDAPDDEAR